MPPRNHINKLTNTYNAPNYPSYVNQRGPSQYTMFSPNYNVPDKSFPGHRYELLKYRKTPVKGLTGASSGILPSMLEPWRRISETGLIIPPSQNVSVKMIRSVYDANVLPTHRPVSIFDDERVKLKNSTVYIKDSSMKKHHKKSKKKRHGKKRRHSK